MRVLVVEDEFLIADFVTTALAEAGHKVLGPVAKITEALEIARQSHPDVALVDVNLARGDNGVDLARELKARWAIPVIFASGQPHLMAPESGAIGYLAKPYTPAMVCDCVSFIGEALKGSAPKNQPNGLVLYHGAIEK